MIINKKILGSFILSLIGFISFSQTINYNFTATTGAYVANGTGTVSLIGPSVDIGTSASTPIGFTFQFGCQNYTTFEATSNGVMFLGTSGAGSNDANDLTGASDRPIIAPLWDDMQTGVSASGGKVTSVVTGVSPNRILTVEWKAMKWGWSATNPAISFQAKLYETSNRIDFCYLRITATNTLAPSASIGLGGVVSGDFYSLNGTGAGPTASKITETTNLTTCPATNQIYRWDPVLCSGLPTVGTPSASPQANCAAFTTTLDVGTGSGCGITYQWQQSATGSPPFSNFGTATSATSQTFAITGTTYFRCIATCLSSALSATSSVISASVNAASIGAGSYSVSMPYSTTGQTTCGFNDDITSANVTNICGSSNYYTGEDAVYIFTPSSSGVLNATVTTTGTYLGMMLYQGCPTSAAGVCVDNAQSSSTGSQNLSCSALVTSGQTYYLVIDSWTTPVCNPYDLSLSVSTCTSAPSPGTPVAAPVQKCGAFTTTLSITGITGCGLSYQWQTSTTAGGVYSNIVGATALTATASIAAGATKFYRCLVSCGAFTSTTSIVSATSIASGTCGCEYNVTLPYSVTGQTTCGQGNAIFATGAGSVTNVCGSTSYYTGEDVLYSFTAGATGQSNIILNSSGSYTGLMLYQGCPTSGGVCVANSQSSTGAKTVCPNLTSGVKYYLVLDSYASPTCNDYDISISAPGAAGTTTCNMAYTAATTTYSFETFTGTVLPTTDDVLFNSIINFGFPLCYDGAKYFGGYVASNSSFVFDAVPCFPNIQNAVNAGPGVSTGYSITNPAPTATTSIPRNAILAPWHDVNPSLGGVIQYTTVGTAPNRRCVISFENIPMYSCGTSSPTIYHSSQIKLFETTNTIEIHVKQKKVCPGWNSGGAVLGLLNYNGTVYVPPVSATAHNVNAALTYTWTLANTAYKFTTSCGTSGGTCKTLPIGFKDFYGERVDHVNHLYWQTATESDLKDFAVQRSTDGVNFETIGHVHPNNAPGNYTFDDADAPVGIISYYRIEIDEYSGIISYTDVYPIGSGANEILNVSQLFPNPASTDFTIAFDSKKTGVITINVFDIYGKLAKRGTQDIYTGVTRTTMEIDDLSNGVYYVEVVNNFNEPIAKQKLVIQR